MHKLTNLALSALAFSFIITTACSKSSSSSSSSIVGSWKVTKQYQDYNKNGIMDANELDSSVLIESVTVKYNSNGSGIETIVGFQEPFTWKLVNNNTYLFTTDTTQSPPNTYFKIASLTATSMELIDTTDQAKSGISWTFFSKQ